MQVEIETALATPAWDQAVRRYGWTSLELTGAEFGAYLDRQAEVLARTLKALGFIR
jgi:tripartite-type tricarboxylate transporter receptor subunit TctC